MSKANRSDKRAQDYVVNKILCVFTLAFLLILGLMNVSRMMSRANSYVLAFKAMPYIAAGFALLTIGCAVWALIAKKKGIDTQYRLFTGAHFTVVFAFCALCTALLAMAFNKGTLTFLYVMIPAVAVLYIVFYSYPRDFFAIASSSGIGAIAVWVIASLKTGGLYPALMLAVFAFSVIALAIRLICTVIAQKNGGKLFGKDMLASDARYALMYVTYALVLAALTVALVLGNAALYYAAFGLVGYLVLVGIYYTLRQI